MRVGKGAPSRRAHQINAVLMMVGTALRAFAHPTD
jgi:hypothetical protein